MSEQERSEQEATEQEPALDVEVAEDDATEVTGGATRVVTPGIRTGTGG